VREGDKLALAVSVALCIMGGAMVVLALVAS
jgi:hypothetical protein